MNEASILQSLKDAMTAMEADRLMALLEKGDSTGISAHTMMDALTDAIHTIGERFAEGECFIPELILCGQMFEQAMVYLEPRMTQDRVQQNKGRVLVGTVQGDLHDLGIKLVALTLTMHGFEVVNLGIDVSADTFIEKIQELEPHILGLSALLTTTLNQQREVIEALTAQGLRDRVKVVVGGAPVTQEWADSIGADAVGFDAIDALEKIQALTEGGPA